MESSTGTLFGEIRRRDVESRTMMRVIETIRTTDNDELQEADKDEFVDELVAKHGIDVATIDPDERRGRTAERSGDIYLEVEIPYAGSPESFRYNPSSLEWPIAVGEGAESFEITIESEHVSFEVQISDREADDVREAIQERIEFIEAGMETLRSDFGTFESQLREEAADVYDSQLETAEEVAAVIDALDMPVEDYE